jgi:hypothetical protein
MLDAGFAEVPDCFKGRKEWKNAKTILNRDNVNCVQSPLSPVFIIYSFFIPKKRKGKLF